MQIKVSIWPKAENLATSVNIALENLELETWTFKSFLEYFSTSVNIVLVVLEWCGVVWLWSGLRLQGGQSCPPNNPRNGIRITSYRNWESNEHEVLFMHFNLHLILCNFSQSFTFSFCFAAVVTSTCIENILLIFLAFYNKEQNEFILHFRFWSSSPLHP